MACLHLLARSGLETNVELLAGTVLLATGSIGVVMICDSITWGHRQLQTSFAALTALVALAWPIVALAAGGIALIPFVVSTLFALCVFGRRIRQSGFLSLAGVILAAAGANVLIFLWTNGAGASTNIYALELGSLGLLSLDSYYHAALAEMLRNHGVISTGMDGLKPAIYHVGSHVWIAALATATNTSVIEAYPVALQVFAIPVLLFLFMRAAVQALPAASLRPALVLGTALTVITVAQWLVVWEMEFVSESYAFSLLLMLLALPILWDMLRDRSVPGHIAALRVLACTVFVPVLCIVKIPVGVVWAAAILLVPILRFTDRPRLRIGVGAVLAVVAIAAAYLTVNYVVPGRIGDLIDPLGFARENPRQFLGNLSVGLGCAALIVFGPVPRSENHRKLGLFLLILCFIGNVPGLLFQFAQGGGVYFVNTVTWLCLPLLCAEIYRMEHRLGRRALVPAMVLLSGLALMADTSKWRRNVETVEFIQKLQSIDTEPPSEVPDKRKLLAAIGDFLEIAPQIMHRALQQGSLFSPANAVALRAEYGPRAIKAVRDMRAAGLNEFPVFVPPGNVSFWSIGHRCNVAALLLPAMTGTQMIRGIPPLELGCKTGIHYGFSKYGDESRSIDLADDELCEAARSRAFGGVWILGGTTSDVELRTLVCN